MRLKERLGFHVCMCVCVHWLYLCTLSKWCAVNMPLKYQSKMCGECVCSLHIKACFPYHIIRVFLGHTRLTLIGWVWTSCWRGLKWEWRGRAKHFWHRLLGGSQQGWAASHKMTAITTVDVRRSYNLRQTLKVYSHIYNTYTLLSNTSLIHTLQEKHWQIMMSSHARLLCAVMSCVSDRVTNQEAVAFETHNVTARLYAER